MTGATLHVSFEAPELRRALAEWRALGRAPDRLWRAVGPRLVSNTHDRFDAATDPEGRPWQALSRGYAPLKRGPGILRESGMRGGLMGSITFAASGGELSIGSNKVYAAIHQFGGTIRAKNGPYLIFRMADGMRFVPKVEIPARPYLGISRTDEEDVLDAVQALLLRA